MRRQDVAAEVDFLRRCGQTPHEICAQLQMTPAAVARALFRAERPDLGRTFERLRTRPRGTCRFCGGPTCERRFTACTAHRETARAETLARRAVPR